MNGWLLDTNVISELRMHRHTSPAVLAWQRSISKDPLYLSVITILEIEKGIRRVKPRNPEFARTLAEWLEKTLIPTFRDSILNIDLPVAFTCARFATSRTLPQHDALIAATAAAHSLTLATRNTRDFADTRIDLCNPWAHPLS